MSENDDLQQPMPQTPISENPPPYNSDIPSSATATPSSSATPTSPSATSWQSPLAAPTSWEAPQGYWGASTTSSGSTADTGQQFSPRPARAFLADSSGTITPPDAPTAEPTQQLPPPSRAQWDSSPQWAPSPAWDGEGGGNYPPYGGQNQWAQASFDSTNWNYAAYQQPPQKKGPSTKIAAALTALAVLVAMVIAILLPQWQSLTAANTPTVPAPTQVTEPTDNNSQTQEVSQTQSNATAAQAKGVVLINTTLPSATGAGTGMVLSSDGYVLTNYHVVNGSTAVQATVASTGKVFSATVVGHDATNDVALLKLSGASGLDTVTIDNDTVNIGDQVTAVGNSNGQGFLSAAAGSITRTSSTVTVTSDRDTNTTETLTNVFMTSTSAVPGDSGGPMYDSHNEVLGMTTAGQQQQNSYGQSTTVASWAIPIAKAMSIVKQIETGNSSGTVQVGPRAYLGVTVQASQGNLVVNQVVAGGPASTAGIPANAIITAIDGKAISSQADLSAVLNQHKPNDQIRISLSNGTGQTASVQVTLGTSPVN